MWKVWDTANSALVREEPAERRLDPKATRSACRPHVRSETLIAL